MHDADLFYLKLNVLSLAFRIDQTRAAQLTIKMIMIKVIMKTALNSIIASSFFIKVFFQFKLKYMNNK